MLCKYCQREVPEGAKFCLHCGKEIVDEQISAQELLTEAEQDQIIIAADENPQAEEETVRPEEVAAGSKNLKKMKRIAAISGCIAALAVLGTVLVVGIMGNWSIFRWLLPRDNDVYYKPSYSVSDKKAVSKGNEVVGTMGDIQLTNTQLQLHYWMQVYDFIDYYGYYVSMMGLDYTAPLDEQQIEEGITWQQYFLEAAVQNWQSYAALSLEAKANGFTLAEDYQKALNELKGKMQESATKGGFASIDAMLQDEMGAGITFQHYYDYLEQYYTGYGYFQDQYDKIQPTEEQIEAYFAQNKEKFKEQSITKESGKYVDVRHVLKLIDNYGEKNKDAAKDDPNFGYSQEAWDKCLADAQKLLDEWLAGEKTEESFGKMANEHSDDQDGNVTNGGLYEGVTKGKMVEPFENWCFDEVRVVGDYGLVKTQYGYHIMYFSGSEDIWHAEAKNGFISEEVSKLVEQAIKNHPIEVDYKKVVLAVVKIG